MARYVQVVTTVDSMAAAERIARTVVEQRLAACVQISQCTSIYRWQGAIESAAEFSCVMKSREDLCAELESVIRRCHPYEVPEILVAEVLSGNPEYLDWLNVELRPEGRKA